MYVVVKKILIIFVLISTSLISYSLESLEVQLVSISNIYYNRNGSEWMHNVIVNQKPLVKNKSLYFKRSETNILFIEINCRKNEKKYQDYGVNEIDLSKEYFFTGEVTVIENGECYNLPSGRQEAIKQNGNIVLRIKIK